MSGSEQARALELRIALLEKDQQHLASRVDGLQRIIYAVVASVGLAVVTAVMAQVLRPVVGGG